MISRINKPLTGIIFHLFSQLIAFFLYYKIFDILKHYFDEETLKSWYTVAIFAVVLFVISAVWIIISWLQKKRLNIWYAFFVIIAYCSFLIFYSFQHDDLFDWNQIPNWVLDEVTVPFLYYVCTLVGIFHALIILVHSFTPKQQSKLKIWSNILWAGLIPLGWYILIQLGSSLYLGRFDELIVYPFIFSTALFLFFVFRFIYSITQNGNLWKNYRTLIVVFFGIILPLIGLYFNNFGIGFDIDTGKNIFGNFSHPLFYIIAIINAVLLAIPIQKVKSEFLKVLLFIGHCIGFAYTLYFFAIFLPFLPLSIIAIVIIGLGFLLLAPIFLFIIHLQVLYEDFRYLLENQGNTKSLVISILSFMVIPTIMIWNMISDKILLSKTLDSIYSYSLDSKIQEEVSSEKVLDLMSEIANAKTKNLFFLEDQNQQPIITPLYRTIVLDNLTLSDHKIETILEIYTPKQKDSIQVGRFRGWRWFGGGRPATNSENRLESSNAKLDSVQIKTEVKKQNNQYESWIHIETTNGEGNLQEFVSLFSLPEQAFINDYYLMIDGEKVHGILAEKKSVTWIYNEITNTNRDPGIIRYFKDKQLAMHVYPFAENETRQFGFKVLHKSPIQFQFKNQNVVLGDSLQIDNELVQFDDDSYYLSKEYLAQLSNHNQNPHFYCILNSNDIQEKNKIQNTLNKLKSKYPNGKITLVKTDANANFIDYESLSDLENKESNHRGFFLEKAIKQILYKSNLEEDFYPVLSMISDKDSGIWVNENLAFYDFVTDDLTLYPKDSVLNKMFPIKEVKQFKVGEKFRNIRNWKEGQVVSFQKNPKLNIDDLEKSDWNSSMKMRAFNQWLLLHPENLDKDWLTTIAGSFKTQSMNPYTSFISLENEAQRKILLKKQEQVLSGKYGLDPDEEMRSMSEPSFWIVLFVVIGLLGIKLKYKL